MSYLYVGVGGSGAKLMQALVHLAAAGLLPEGGRELMGFLVDPDQSNGSVTECTQAGALYDRCKKLQFGTSGALFKNRLTIRGPWSPVVDIDVADLNSVFDLPRMRRVNPVDADLMEVLFSPEERSMPILQGFRGRPAIGATIFGRTVSFDDPMWSELRTRPWGQGRTAPCRCCWPARYLEVLAQRGCPRSAGSCARTWATRSATCAWG